MTFFGGDVIVMGLQITLASQIASIPFHKTKLLSERGRFGYKTTRREQFVEFDLETTRAI